MPKKFIKWLVCDQDKNKCPSLQELKEEVNKYYDGDPGSYEFEISLVKENNKFGQQSAGWAGNDKIILFDNENFEFEAIEDLHKNLERMYQRAEKKCKSMNDNHEEYLY